jgi:hypothetical protein
MYVRYLPHIQNIAKEISFSRVLFRTWIPHSWPSDGSKSVLPAKRWFKRRNPRSVVQDPNEVQARCGHRMIQMAAKGWFK